MGKGAGPGVSFANEMFRLTGVPQGLICCAHGGTTMAQWDPKLKKDGDNSLYGAMLNRVKRNGGEQSADSVSSSAMSSESHECRSSFYPTWRRYKSDVRSAPAQTAFRENGNPV